MLFQRPVQVCAGQEIAFGDVYLNSRGLVGGQGMVLGFEPRATCSSPELSAQPSGTTMLQHTMNSGSHKKLCVTWDVISDLD